mmetsp:Transcript_17878/g.40512  ORF Transcript_17878/g.40512 Transcript_17878/m.40512 type:complete len:411 (-) Transcript_17878:582-1814(-)
MFGSLGLFESRSRGNSFNMANGSFTFRGSSFNFGGGSTEGRPTLIEIEQQRKAMEDESKKRDQLKQDVIEVATFLHQVRRASLDINMHENAASIRKPQPVKKLDGHTRRTMSGTVYPSPSPFEENSNVGICMLLPPDLPQGAVTIDLEQFFLRCPIDSYVTCVRWGDNTRGVPRKKKGQPEAKNKARSANKFDHCCFVSMSLPGGFDHVSVKVFKTGRLQTAGCRDGAMSLTACKVVASCVSRIVNDGIGSPLLQGEGNPNWLHKLCIDAPTNVRLEKESILGVFDLGFREKGFTVDMEELRLLLSHPDNSSRVCKVHVPKADIKQKVNRFQGLGVYVNKDCLTDASNNVFVNIFPTGKCTVTAASSLQQAEEVARVIGDLIIDLFVQCRKRASEDEITNGGNAKRTRRR